MYCRFVAFGPIAVAADVLGVCLFEAVALGIVHALRFSVEVAEHIHPVFGCTRRRRPKSTGFFLLVSAFGGRPACISEQHLQKLLVLGVYILGEQVSSDALVEF